MVRGLLSLLFFIACSTPGPAAADWLLSPYIGVQFAADTNFLVGFQQERTKFSFGASFGVLTDGIVGVEADVAFVPQFFQGGLVTRSGTVTSVMGNVIVAAPLGVASYGLRPYAVGGVGWLHAGGGSDLFGTLIDSNLFGMNVGGGAIGPITPRSSLRFDLRYFRSLGSESETLVFAGESARLSFWRGTIGLAVRF